MILEHPEAEIEITELSDGKRQVTVRPACFSLSPVDQSIQTEYPLELIQQILRVKGPRYLNDEIRRQEDPDYVTICLEKDLLSYVSEKEFESKRILDFGCGGGASSVILAKRFPHTEIIGVELDPGLIELARMRARHFGLNNLSFQTSPDSRTLPQALGMVDFVLLSAVYEHLLPSERDRILQQIWSVLKPGGVLFLNQTPYRYFPFEGHTTHLLFINYLPDKIAYHYALRFSKRVGPEETWDHLLRRGIRGGSPHEILRILKKAQTQGRPQIMKPMHCGFRDRIDVWYAGYAVSIARKYPRVIPLQNLLRWVSKVIYWCCGIVFLPTVAIAVRKSADPA